LPRSGGGVVSITRWMLALAPETTKSRHAFGQSNQERYAGHCAIQKAWLTKASHRKYTLALETAVAMAPADVAPAEYASVRDGATYCSSKPNALNGNAIPAAASCACDASTQSACNAAFSAACMQGAASSRAMGGLHDMQHIRVAGTASSGQRPCGSQCCNVNMQRGPVGICTQGYLPNGGGVH
jgi:hypothetical protein